ncbi:hypothetical protein ACLB2K_064222 [Fragaria x ananassa]
MTTSRGRDWGGPVFDSPMLKLSLCTLSLFPMSDSLPSFGVSPLLGVFCCYSDFGKRSNTEEDEYGNPIRKKTLKFGGVKVKPWIRSVDINNPQFSLCLAFPNDEQCKEALREYAIRNQVGLWFEKNETKKILVKCQRGCPFKLYASRPKGWGDTMLVRTLINKHTCSPVQISHFLTYRRIVAEVKNTLLVDEDWSRKGSGLSAWTSIAWICLDMTPKLTHVVVVIVRRRQVDQATPAGGQVEQHLLCPAYPNSPILTPLSTPLRTGGRVAEPERR